MEVAQSLADESLRQLKALLEGPPTSPSASAALIDECESSVKNAELEIRASGKLSSDSKLKAWIKTSRAQLIELKRRALLGGDASTSCASVSQQAVDDRARTATVTRNMQTQNDTLMEARHALQETEHAADGIMLNLAVQKETIRSTQQKVNEVEGDLGYANKLLTSMKQWWKIGSIQK